VEAPAAADVKDVAADLDLLDIRVGKVLKAWKHPEADSLFVEVGVRVDDAGWCEGVAELPFADGEDGFWGLGRFLDAETPAGVDAEALLPELEEKVLVVLHKASNVPLFAPYREQIDDILEKAEKNSNITLSALATIPVLLFTLLFRLCFGEKQSVLTTETIKKEDLATADEEATFPGTVDK
jgi:hypothetical protein